MPHDSIETLVGIVRFSADDVRFTIGRHIEGLPLVTVDENGIPEAGSKSPANVKTETRTPNR